MSSDKISDTEGRDAEQRQRIVGPTLQARYSIVPADTRCWLNVGFNGNQRKTNTDSPYCDCWDLTNRTSIVPCKLDRIEYCGVFIYN